ncbi:hypothetical protein ACFX12_018146 [Malus domestica]
MSIALQRNGGGGNNMNQRPRFIHGTPCIPIYNSSEGFAQDRRLDQEDSCSSSSSSVGMNSDSSDGSSEGEESGETGVQSSFKGPLDTMDQLEEVLPVKRGISKFYSGKSKSFTSLADVSSVSSVKELAKPKNRYTKKRKNLLAQNYFQDKNCNDSMTNNGVVISKRPAANPSRGSFIIGETWSSSPSYSNGEGSNSISPSPSSCLPPLPPHGRQSPDNDPSPPLPRRSSPWRSFSLSDLQCIAAATPDITGV